MTRPKKIAQESATFARPSDNTDSIAAIAKRNSVAFALADFLPFLRSSFHRLFFKYLSRFQSGHPLAKPTQYRKLRGCAPGHPFLSNRHLPHRLGRRGEPNRQGRGPMLLDQTIILLQLKYVANPVPPKPLEFQWRMGLSLQQVESEVALFSRCYSFLIRCIRLGPIGSTLFATRGDCFAGTPPVTS